MWKFLANENKCCRSSSIESGDPTMKKSGDRRGSAPSSDSQANEKSFSCFIVFEKRTHFLLLSICVSSFYACTTEMLFSLVFAAAKHRSLIHQNLFTPFANLSALQPFACGLVNKLLGFSHQLQATQSSSGILLGKLSALWQSSKIFEFLMITLLEKRGAREETDSESKSGWHQKVYACSQFIDTSVALLLPAAYKTPRPKPTQQWASSRSSAHSKFLSNNSPCNVDHLQAQRP